MKNTKVINLRLDNCLVKVLRINALSKESLKAFKWLPITNSAYFDFSMKISQDPLILPKFYAGLTYLTGPSDKQFNPYKGSYSFMFGIEVKKNDKVSKYCYHIYHYRSYIEFDIEQPVLPSDPREARFYCNPNDELFSDRDICNLSNAFYSYVIKCMEAVEYVPSDFLKCSDSNLLLFGYLKNKYFFEDYDDEDVYQSRKEILCGQICEKPKKDFFSDINPSFFTKNEFSVLSK